MSMRNMYFFLERFIPYEINFHLLLNLSYLNSKIKCSRLKSSHNFKELKDISASLKRTDSLFILGSGSSINDITLEQWDIISQFDSVGFNFWLIHNFVPSFYVYEESHIDSRNKVFYEMLNRKVNEYKNVPLIIKDIESDKTKLEGVPKALKEQVYLSSSIGFIGSQLQRRFFCQNLHRVVSFIEKKNKKHGIQWIFSRKASLCYLIFMGYLLGYKRIILCGVDLNHNKYFYEDEKYILYLEPEIRRSLLSSNNLDGKISQHLTNVVSDIFIDMSIFDIIFNINQEILLPNKIELGVLGSKSILNSFLPEYRFF